MKNNKIDAYVTVIDKSSVHEMSVVDISWKKKTEEMSFLRVARDPRSSRAMADQNTDSGPGPMTVGTAVVAAAAVAVAFPTAWAPPWPPL